MASALFGGLKAAVTAVSVSMATMPAEQISTTGSAFRVVGAKRNRCLIAKTSAIKTTVLQHRPAYAEQLSRLHKSYQLRQLRLGRDTVFCRRIWRDWRRAFANDYRPIRFLGGE